MTSAQQRFTGARLRGLDGIRALAVVAVVVFHFEPSLLPGGFLGVDVFFALSGFLITRLLLAEIERTGHLGFARFYLRRARRLLPAAITAIGVVGLCGLLVWRDDLPYLRGAVLSSLGYVTNWWQIYVHQSYFVSSGRPSMLQHLWSLAIEEQFYLLWPVVLAAVLGLVSWRGRRTQSEDVSARRLGLLAAVAALLAAVSTIAMTVIAVSTDVPYRTDSNRIYFGTDTHAMGLLLGSMAAALLAMREVQVRGTPRRSPRTLALTDLLGIGSLVALVVMAEHTDEFSVSLYRGGFLLVSAFATVLVVATSRRGSLVGWLLDRRPLRWLGERSYAIYLWHWPVAVVTRPDLDIDLHGSVLFALRSAITLALATASYRFIERPARAAGWSGILGALRLNQAPGALARRLVPAVAISTFIIVLLGIGTSGAPPVLAARIVEPAAVRPGAALSVTHPDPYAISSVAPSSSSSSSSAPAPHPAKPTHRSTTPPAPHAYVAFGDSVMVGAVATLRTRFPGISVQAREGQLPWITLGKIASSQLAHDPGAVVIIHTGDNGVIPPDQLRSVLTSLKKATKVFVLNDRVPRNWQDVNNSLLHSVVPKYPNAVLLDWHHESGRHPDWLYTDGIHLRPNGASGYSTFVADGVRRHLA